MLLDHAKFAAKSAALFAGETMKFAVPGVLLSLTLAVWGSWLLSAKPGSTSAGADGMMGLLTSLPGLCLAALYLAFPIAYVLYGKTRGIDRVIGHFAQNKKDALIEYAVERFAAFSETRAAGFFMKAVHTQQEWSAMFNQFLADRAAIPGVVRRVVHHYADKADFAQLIGVAASEIKGPLSVTQITDAVAQKLGDKLDALSEPVSVNWYWGLIAANIGLFVILRSQL